MYKIFAFIPWFNFFNCRKPSRFFLLTCSFFSFFLSLIEPNPSHHEVSIIGRVFPPETSKSTLVAHWPNSFAFLPKRISKRGSVLKVRGGCYNYRFRLYKWMNVATKTVVANSSWQNLLNEARYLRLCMIFI